jgi:hypothetical protein
MDNPINTRASLNFDSLQNFFPGKGGCPAANRAGRKVSLVDIRYRREMQNAMQYFMRYRVH